MTQPLKHRERKLFEFIRAKLKTHGIAPSFDEMRVFMGYRSKSGIFNLLWWLESKGKIRRLVRRARGIKIISESPLTDSADAIYLADLNLIQALRFAPDRLLRSGDFRSPSVEKRASLLGIQFKTAAHPQPASAPTVRT